MPKKNVPEKTVPGNYFEDFSLGQHLPHPTPRTLNKGDGTLYTALHGTRFALHSSDMFARNLGLTGAPMDDMLVFHTVFGKSVPEISRNAIANLGYANGRFMGWVFPGDTLRSQSEVIGLKENSNGKTGVVYVKTTGINQHDDVVLEYTRWVMVHKKNPASPPPDAVVPDLPAGVEAARIHVPDDLRVRGYDTTLAGAAHLWEDYTPGEKIDHVDGMTVEEADHMLATRLYQNTARVHFNQYEEDKGRFGRRLIYGGYIISMARALSFNGLGNALRIAAINGGRHVAPTFATNTIHAWSEIIDKFPVMNRTDLGALRVRTVATVDRPCHDFPLKDTQGKDASGVVLDFDYTVLMPTHAGIAR